MPTFSTPPKHALIHNFVGECRCFFNHGNAVKNGRCCTIVLNGLHECLHDLFVFLQIVENFQRVIVDNVIFHLRNSIHTSMSFHRVFLMATRKLCHRNELQQKPSISLSSLYDDLATSPFCNVVISAKIFTSRFFNI